MTGNGFPTVNSIEDKDEKNFKNREKEWKEFTFILLGWLPGTCFYLLPEYSGSQGCNRNKTPLMKAEDFSI